MKRKISSKPSSKIVRYITIRILQLFVSLSLGILPTLCFSSIVEIILALLAGILIALIIDLIIELVCAKVTRDNDSLVLDLSFNGYVTIRITQYAGSLTVCSLTSSVLTELGPIMAAVLYLGIELEVYRYCISPDSIKYRSQNKVTVFLISELIAVGEVAIGTASFGFKNTVYAMGHASKNAKINDFICGTIRHSPIPNSEETTGRICADIDPQKSTSFGFGKVISNDDSGMLIHADDLDESMYETISIANEIKKGDAELLLSDETGTLQKFSVCITIGRNWGEQILLVELTDKRLLQKTNGFLPGMSGTPIVQNNALIGILSQCMEDPKNKGIAKIIWHIPKIRELLNEGVLK